MDLGMRLGEASGAALALGVIRAACRLPREMATFAEAGVSRKAPDRGVEAGVSAGQFAGAATGAAHELGGAAEETARTVYAAGDAGNEAVGAAREIADAPIARRGALPRG